MNPDVIALMTVFAKVAQRSSFSLAAQDLQTSAATVSRKIVQLEVLLKVRLFERSTRHVQLTEIGSAYYERCMHVLHLAEESTQAIHELQSEPRGHLRVTAPILFGNLHLSRVVNEYMNRYPEVSVELQVSDQLESLAMGRVDVAVRITNHLDDNVVARHLTTIDWTVCASPAYLAKHGMPVHPSDLTQHDCYHYPSVIRHSQWSFDKDGEKISVPIRGRLKVNSSQIIADLAEADMGIGLLPNYLISPSLSQGRLISLLSNYKPSVNSALYAVTTSNRYATAKVSSFIGLLKEHFGNRPDWSR
jgi:DNA-binding transcriptional LysR family regulator